MNSSNGNGSRDTAAPWYEMPNSQERVADAIEADNMALGKAMLEQKIALNEVSSEQHAAQVQAAEKAAEQRAGLQSRIANAERELARRPSQSEQKQRTKTV